MWPNCFRTLLLKYSRSSSLLLGKSFKLSSINPFQLDVIHINKIHKFSPSNSFSLSCKNVDQFEKFEDSGQHRKKFRQLSVDELLTKITRPNFFDSPFAVKRVVDALHKATQIEKWTAKDYEGILKHEGFYKFIMAFEIYMKELPMRIDDTLIKLLEIYRHLHIPYSNPQCAKIISAIEERLNFLSFGQVASFYLALSSSKSYTNGPLLLKLKEMLIEDLKNGIYNKNIDYAVLSLIICNQNFVTNEIRKAVLTKILKLPEWNNFAIHKYFIQVFSQLDLNDPSYEHIKDDYLKMLKTQLVNSDFISSFLTGYATLLNKNKINYYDWLIDDIVNKILEKKLALSDFMRVTSAMQISRHINDNFLKHIVNLIKAKSNFLRKNPPALMNCIKLLADSNNSEFQDNRWDGIQPFLQDLLVSSNFFQNIKGNFNDLLHHVTRLASLGIYDDESLRILSSHINNHSSEKLRQSINLMYLTGLLHQAVKEFHPSFSEVLVDDHILSFIFEKLRQLNYVPFEKLKMLRDMQNEMYRISYRSGTILLNCLSKNGMLIDGVVAMNDKGKFYSFEENQKKSFIEDIVVPENYELVTVTALPSTHYSKRGRFLKSYCSLHLKTLRAMGYRSVQIFECDWYKALNNDTQGQYMLSKIREKRFGWTSDLQPDESSFDSGG